MSVDKTFTREEVAKHNTAKDCWIIIDSIVYDVSKFIGMHPGGESVLLDVAGKECTEEFYGLHRHEVIQKFGPKYKIGLIVNEKPKIIGESLSAISKVPYAEASYWMGFKSPYYNDGHKRFREEVRKFVHSELYADGKMMEEMGKNPSKELWQKMGQFGLLASRIGPGPHFKFVPRLPGGVKPDEFDYFHEMIAHEEVSRMGLPGYSDGLGAGLVIGLPPVLAFGTKQTIAKYAPPVLLGDKRICLAISEPTAGSDVANIATRAVKSPCGKFYIVSGVKKWITNGTFADIFVTAVRTGGPGIGGISLLVIDRSEGVETKPIKTSYSPAAGTAYITFENVKVPVENLLGQENKGFQCIMYNFNHERWLIVCGVVRGTRLVVEECFKWANQRKVFGKKLLEQPVIRFKLANMVAQLEAVQNWMENITYQMNQMSYKEQSVKLAGPIALLKYQSTRIAASISDEACQIFGGRAITRTGMGSVVEGFQKTFKFGAILGGSEEIMADLGVRQAIRDFPQHARL